MTAGNADRAGNASIASNADGAGNAGNATARIRLATSDDGHDIAAIYAPFVLGSHTSFELLAPDGAEMGKRIASTLLTHPWIVLDDGGKVTGYAYASVHRTRSAYQWSCEVSVYIGEGARRRGAGRALYSALFRLLVHQGFYNAYAGIALPNDASIALHESLGFKKLGVFEKIGFKDGAFVDVGWWQLALEDAARPPAAAPRPLATIPAEEISRLLLEKYEVTVDQVDRR